MGNEYQALIVHYKSSRTNYNKGKPSHKYLSKIRCYTCDKKGHYARECPRNKSGSHKKKGSKKIHHAHTPEDDEPLRKKAKEESDDSSSEEEYVLISALIGNITHGINDWIIDSGASKHMMGFKKSFVKLSEHESPHKVKLGDDYQYPIKGWGESSYKLDSGKSVKMKDVLYVPGLKKNLLSISTLG